MNEIFHRTSIRKYKDIPVEKEKLFQLLKAGMAAPSAKNQQPWEFYLVTDKKMIEALSKTSPYASFTSSAAAMIVPCYKTECLLPEFAQIDLSIATENILLEADSLSLGACWIGIAPIEDRMKEVERVLSIPSNLRAFCIVSIGYPAEERKQQDRFNENKIHIIE